jgi:hypothetical protein
VLELLVWLVFHGVRFSIVLQLAKRNPPKTSRTKSSNTTNFEQDRCGNSSTQSQAPDNGYINFRNMLSTYEMK